MAVNLTKALRNDEVSSSSPYFFTFPPGTTEAFERPSEYITEVEIFLMVLFITLTILTVIGNLMALSVFARIPPHKTVSVIFFISMALADISNGIFTMPFSVYSLNHHDRMINQNSTGFRDYCVFSGILHNTTKNASLFTLILICFDRFMSVHDALHKELLMTLRKCLLMVASCWLCSLLIAIFPYFIVDRNEVYENYVYNPKIAQCDYNVQKIFNTSEFGKKTNSGGKTYPPNIIISYLFVNILPIIIPTYLIVMFCIAVIFILRSLFKNSKRLRQQVEPERVNRSRSLRNSVNMRSFKRKNSEKQVTTQLDKVKSGYTEIHMGSGTASDNLEGEVVLRRSSRRVASLKANHSPRSRDRWSQLSVKSLQKRTKADHQQRAIQTVIMMLLFFIFCYSLYWFIVIYTLFYYLKLAPYIFPQTHTGELWQKYVFTLITVLKYLNCAGNPFLYYFRMTQFKKEVEGIKASLNGTNRAQTSARSGRSGGYISLTTTRGSKSASSRPTRGPAASAGAGTKLARLVSDTLSRSASRSAVVR